MKLSQHAVKRIHECNLLGMLNDFPEPKKLLVQITSWTEM